MMAMKEKIVHFLKTKGYYMVLALSVLTVGGVSFLSYRISQKEEAKTPLSPNATENVEKVEENVPDERKETAEKTEPPAPDAVQPVPYSAPLQGEVIAPYSPEQPVYSYTLKDWRTHGGVDVAAEAGTPVLNVSEGLVESVTKDDLLGNLVTVRHTDGKYSRYASLGEVSVEEGQMVKLGDPLGTVGRSMLLECGETDHLHFELWENEKTLDPSFLWNKE